MSITPHTEPTTGNALVLASDQDYWNDKQLAALRHMGVENASGGDLAVFHHVCQRTGLDPFAKQIHMIGRNAKNQKTNQWETKYTIQTGIDGFRLIARRVTDRLGEALEYEDTLWCGADGQWTDVWTKPTAPAAAKVTVLRHGRRFPAVALYREYVQTRRDGEPNSMWSSMPAGQLAKCAEALALRKAFPQDLSGIYADEEMGQAEHVARQDVPAAGASAAERMGSILGTTPQTSGPEAPDGAPTPPPVEQDHSGPESPVLDMRSSLAKRMFALMNEVGITERADRLLYASDTVGRDVTTSKEMTEADAHAVIASLEHDKLPVEATIEPDSGAEA